MFVATGLGPYSGQAVHFKHFAPKELEYAHNRYQFEAHRHYKILDDHLANSRYMIGDSYTIVDMAFWGWARMAPFVLGDDAFARYPHVKRLLDEVSARPAAARALALKDKFVFKAEMDDEARHIMFGHLKTQGGVTALRDFVPGCASWRRPRVRMIGGVDFRVRAEPICEAAFGSCPVRPPMP